ARAPARAPWKERGENADAGSRRPPYRARRTDEGARDERRSGKPHPRRDGDRPEEGREPSRPPYRGRNDGAAGGRRFEGKDQNIGKPSWKRNADASESGRDHRSGPPPWKRHGKASDAGGERPRPPRRARADGDKGDRPPRKTYGERPGNTPRDKAPWARDGEGSEDGRTSARPPHRRRADGDTGRRAFGDKPRGDARPGKPHWKRDGEAASAGSDAERKRPPLRARAEGGPEERRRADKPSRGDRRERSHGDAPRKPRSGAGKPMRKGAGEAGRHGGSGKRFTPKPGGKGKAGPGRTQGAPRGDKAPR
ncbi:MAG: hypothetical protein AAGD34_16180, partial [Pseudomonadota bacterium]